MVVVDISQAAGGPADGDNWAARVRVRETGDSLEDEAAGGPIQSDQEDAGDMVDVDISQAAGGPADGDSWAADMTLFTEHLCKPMGLRKDIKNAQQMTQNVLKVFRTIPGNLRYIVYNQTALIATCIEAPPVYLPGPSSVSLNVC